MVEFTAYFTAVVRDQGRGYEYYASMPTYAAQTLLSEISGDIQNQVRRVAGEGADGPVGRRHDRQV